MLNSLKYISIFINTISLCLLCSCNSLDYLINLDKNTQYLMELDGVGPHDSMAIYGDLAVVVSVINNHRDVTGQIYDLTENKLLTTIKFDYLNYDVPHANTACFSSVFRSETSILPLLYISQWEYYSHRVVFVYDIVEDNGCIKANLVQIIDPHKINSEILGEGSIDWVVDFDKMYLYALSYKLPGSSTLVENNEEIIVKFSLPSVNESELVYFLSEQDIKECYRLDTFNYSQDKCYYKDYIFIVSGSSDPKFSYMNRLRILDLNNRKLIENFSLLYFGYREPEGLDFYNGQLLLTFNDKNPGRLWTVNY